MKLLTLFVSLSCLIGCLLLASVASAESQLLRCGTLIDVERKRQIRNQDILVEHGLIREIGHGLKPQPETNVIDLRGRYCLPGLMDMHTHLFVDSSVGTVADNFLKKSSATNALLGADSDDH